VLHTHKFHELLRRHLSLSSEEVGKTRSGQIHQAGHRIRGKPLAYVSLHMAYEEIYSGIQRSHSHDVQIVIQDRVAFHLGQSSDVFTCRSERRRSSAGELDCVTSIFINILIWTSGLCRVPSRHAIELG